MACRLTSPAALSGSTLRPAVAEISHVCDRVCVHPPSMLKDVLLRGRRSYLENSFAVRSEENSRVTCRLLSDRQTAAIESEDFVLLDECGSLPVGSSRLP